MADVYRFDTAIISQTGLPEDAMINTWHFHRAQPSPSDFENVRDLLRDFFIVDPDTATSSGSIASWMSSSVCSGIVGMRAYALDDPEPRAPVWEGAFTLTGLGTGAPLPTEVALCFSFQGIRESGEPQARRQNRKYLGGFRQAACANTGRPNPNFVATVAGAGRRMLEAANAAFSWDWVAYSPTTGDWHAVVDGWVDDAFDTQRRRGYAPSQRYLFTESTPVDA